MNGDQVFVVLSFFVVVFSGVVIATSIIIKRQERQSEYGKAITHNNARFCADCGKPTKEFVYQLGFWAQTGKERVEKTWACPDRAYSRSADLNEVKSNPFCGSRVSKWVTSPQIDLTKNPPINNSYMAGMLFPSWSSLTKAKTLYLPNEHDHDPVKTDYSCQPCLDEIASGSRV